MEKENNLENQRSPAKSSEIQYQEPCTKKPYLIDSKTSIGLLEKNFASNKKIKGRGESTLQNHGYLQLQEKYGNRFVQEFVNMGIKNKSSSISGLKPIMRRALPGGAYILRVVPDVDGIISTVRLSALRSVGGHANRARWDSYLRPLITEATRSNLGNPTIRIDLRETAGVNMNYTGHLTFEMGEPMQIGAGETSTAVTTGGTVTTGSTTAESSTESAEVTGEITSSPGQQGGRGGSGGATLGTSTTRGSETSRSTALSGGGTATANLSQIQYVAPLRVRAVIDGEADFSGSDYLNPFKWGYAAADAVMDNGEQTATATVGRITYFEPVGFAPPRQRKGWDEHSIKGETSLSANDNTIALQANIDSTQFSRSGARHLPFHVQLAAEKHHAVNLAGVRLIQSGPGDKYCNSMNAAAFTTPGPHGSSDIFMNSRLPLSSPEGHHTLQHEISHAAQQMKGETDMLIGLGGNESQRQELENKADRDADVITARQFSETEKEGTKTDS